MRWKWGAIKGSFLYSRMFLGGDSKSVSFVGALAPSKYPNVFFHAGTHMRGKTRLLHFCISSVFSILRNSAQRLTPLRNRSLMKCFVLKCFLHHEREDFWSKHAFQRVPYILWLCGQICEGLKKRYYLYEKCDDVTLRAHFPLLLDWPIML